MFSYNSNVERKIDEYLSKARNDCEEEGIGFANETIKNAVELLDNHFYSHPNDSIEESRIRIESKKRIQENIIETYDYIITHGFCDEELIEKKNLEIMMRKLS